MAEDIDSHLDNFVFFDLECGEDGGIYAFGAVLGNNLPLVARNAEQVKRQMPAFRDWVRSARFVCGHNIISHDLPELEQLHGPKDYEGKVVDTLYLSPIAYPSKPYHALTKEDKLVRESRNDPVQDSRSCRKLLSDIFEEFQKLSNQDLELYSCAFTLAGLYGMASVFQEILGSRGSNLKLLPEATNQRLLDLFKTANSDRCCVESIEVIEGGNGPLVLAYIHSWLQSAAGSSSIPYWVTKQIPQIRKDLRKLRAEPCQSSGCRYCREAHDPTRALSHFFNFPSFRSIPEVKGQPGKSLQEAIVATAMRNESVLGILPTGGGKSLCFQIPALHRYRATGALTIIISPLQSLMRDQVENLRVRTDGDNTAALYGLLTPVERKICLHDIRMGHIGLLYVSPEQLRSPAFLEAIKCREIAYWVFDEAHCLSKWGHDFRVDYLYASKFIKKHSEEGEIPPVICVTATAKESVKQELIKHFQEGLGHELQLLDGGTERANLNYQVESIAGTQKGHRVLEILESLYGSIPTEADPEIQERFLADCIETGAVVIFAATKKRVEEVFTEITNQGWAALFFHGGMKPEKEIGDSPEEARRTKKYVLDQFLVHKSVPIIVATNAFGMGVDKPDIRKVIHVDATGSLENYLQEAGRAGRDGKPAECILLYEPEDMETQFSMEYYSRLSLRDMQQIWNAVYTTRADSTGSIMLTSDEIIEKVRPNAFGFFSEDCDLNDTKIKAAVNYLEDQGFLERTENRARVFEARLLVDSVEEARKKIDRLRVPIDAQKLWISVVRAFLDVQKGEELNVADLGNRDEMQQMYERLNARGERVRSLTTLVFRTLNEMAKPEVGLIKKDLLFSAQLNPREVFTKLDALREHEDGILREVEESFPDQDGVMRVSIRRQNESLLRHDIPSKPDQIERVFKFLSRDGEFLSKNRSQMKYEKSHGNLNIYFKEEFSIFREQSVLRMEIAREVLKSIVSKDPIKADKKEGLYEFSEADVVALLKERLGERVKGLRLEEILHYILLWLHENKVISLQKGRALITSAMTLTLVSGGKEDGRKKQFNKTTHYETQSNHYDDRRLQVHFVGEYANRGIRSSDESHLQFVRDYFEMETKAFVEKYFTSKEQKQVLELATGIDSYRTIIDSLNQNEVQKHVVKSDKPNNDMVLAGPGSGKTRVIAHRCAWLLRMRRVRPSSIVVLCFNRHAALELRRRIWSLVGNDASRVTIQTFHGLALRLLGRTMAHIDSEDEAHGLKFNEIIPEAIRLLEGDGSNHATTLEQTRQSLLGGLSHILVDEYQDIDETAYRFISLLVGKSERESENRLKLLAVGDDDQSIYQFNGANVEYIRRFEKDYVCDEHTKNPKKVIVHHMVENYRSTENIIRAGNSIIENNKDRMKKAHPIKIDALRATHPQGGILEDLDPVAQGKVQVLQVASRLEQAYACVEEVQRYLALKDTLQPEDCCVVARTNAELVPLRIAMEQANIPCSIVGSEAVPNLNRVREIHDWLEFLKKHEDERWSGEKLLKTLNKKFKPEFLGTSIGRIVLEIAREFYGEVIDFDVPCADIRDFFYDALFEQKRRGFGGSGVMLATAHKVKGLEFDNVLILDGPWALHAKDIRELEEARRLYYVAVTRAKLSLTLFQLSESKNRFIDEIPTRIHSKRSVQPQVIDPQLLNYRHDIISLDDVWVSYAAYLKSMNKISLSLKRAQIGDKLSLVSRESDNGDKHLFLKNVYGVDLVRLSTAGFSKWLPRIKRIHTAQISCVHVRLRDDGTNDNQGANREWLIPVTEVLWRDEPSSARER